MNHYSSKQSGVRLMTQVALLTAIGILIPIIMPFKINLGPFSWTLGSHVAIDIAMFISPLAATFVTLGTTIGFSLGGFTFPVVMRALSHLLFVTIGSNILKKRHDFLLNWPKRLLFNLFINIFHGIGEMSAIYILVVKGMTGLDGNFWPTLFILFGLSPLLHGMMDFEIAYWIIQTLQKRVHLDFPYFPKNK